MNPLYPDPLTQYNSPFICVKSLPIQYLHRFPYSLSLTLYILHHFGKALAESPYRTPIFLLHDNHILHSLHKILSNISNVLLVILGFLYTPRPSHPKPYNMHPHPNYIQLYPHYLYQMTSNINSTHQATKCLNDINIYQCPVEIDALSFCLMFLTILDTSIS